MDHLNNSINAINREDKVIKLRSLGVVVPLRDIPDLELEELLSWYASNPEFIKKDNVEGVYRDESIVEVLADLPVPPDDYAGNLRDWWDKQLRQEGLVLNHFPTTNDYERLCLRCKSVNDCTGSSTCSQCGEDISMDTGLSNFIRVKGDRHTPSGHR